MKACPFCRSTVPGYHLSACFNHPTAAQRPELVEFVARTAHEINRAYCQAIGDDSQPLWEDAPQWQKDSAVKGVEFHRDNPDASPAASHVSWMKQKEAEGWIYGPRKDPEKKQHPCMLPYSMLPLDQRAKDYLFRAVVHQFFHRDLNEAEEASAETPAG